MFQHRSFTGSPVAGKRSQTAVPYFNADDWLNP
jgi:hypothetical protein